MPGGAVRPAHCLYQTFILLMLIPLSLFSAENRQEAAKEVINVALSGRPSNLNPFFARDANSQNINRLLHQSLIDLDQNMQFVCRLCVDFERVKGEGGEDILHFKLREDVTFWDGQTVTAHDVYRSWKMFSDTDKINSIYRFAFGKIKEVRVHDDFKLSIIYPEFELDNVTNLVLLKIIKLKEPSGEATLENIVGAGPYMIRENNPLNIVLAPREENLHPLDFKVVRDETTLALKLINGEIDFSVAHMSPRKSDWLKENHSDKIHIWKQQTSNLIYLGVNHNSPALSQLKVRKAIAQLIPREKIIKYKLRNNAIVSNGMFSQVFEGLYLGPDSHNVYNPKEAIKTLKSLGFSASQPLVIDWKTPSTRSTLEIVQTIAHFLERGPIRVDITIQEWGTFMRSFQQGRYDLILGQWIGFTGPEMLSFVFHSKNIPPNGGNRGHYQNSLVDYHLDKAINQRDKKLRNKHFRKVISAVNEDFAYINLWHPRILWKSNHYTKIGELYPNASFLPFLTLKKECLNEK